MKKKILPSVLIIIFSFTAFTRVEGSEHIKPVLFITILIIGIGLGFLLKTLKEIFELKKKKNAD